MEAVNSFVMSWWPVIVTFLGVGVWVAQSWVHSQTKEANHALSAQITQIAHAVELSNNTLTLLTSRVEAQDARLEAQSHRINQMIDALNLFQMEALKTFITEKDIERLTASVDSLKHDLSAWLTRIETQIERQS